MNKLIVWPSVDEAQEISNMYLELKGFDGVVGMVDGTHIPIRKPSVRGTDYYNRKDFHSVVLQAVTREDMRFIDVSTGWPGKIHDSRVLKISPLFLYGPIYCGDRHLLGDCAYPNLPWLLVPFRDNGHLTKAQKIYNTTLSSIRTTVERAFGLLKGRFKRLQYVDQRDLQTIVHTIVSCCVLHNICIMNSDDFAEMLEENTVHTVEGVPNAENFDRTMTEIGAVKRLQMARRLLH